MLASAGLTLCSFLETLETTEATGGVTQPGSAATMRVELDNDGNGKAEASEPSMNVEFDLLA